MTGMAALDSEQVLQADLQAVSKVYSLSDSTCQLVVLMTL